MSNEFGTFVVDKHVVLKDEGEGTTMHTYKLKEKLRESERKKGKSPMTLSVSADSDIEVLILDSEVAFKLVQPQKTWG